MLKIVSGVSRVAIGRADTVGVTRNADGLPVSQKRIRDNRIGHNSGHGMARPVLALPHRYLRVTAHLPALGLPNTAHKERHLAKCRSQKPIGAVGPYRLDGTTNPHLAGSGSASWTVPVERRRGSMKWNILVGSVVLGLGMCTQSFGFELLDRMLGVDSCCESTCCEKKSCCEAPAPSCGCEAAAPSCGCEAEPCCKTKCRKPLFNFNRCCKPKCCEAAAPSCGCEVAAPTCEAVAPSCGCEAAPKCCKSKCRRTHLLDRIFACKKRCCKPACDSCAVAGPSCGCEGGVSHGVPAPALEGGDAPPMPPAPVVDPSAFVPSQRRVVHASTGSLR